MACCAKNISNRLYIIRCVRTPKILEISNIFSTIETRNRTPDSEDVIFQFYVNHPQEESVAFAVKSKSDAMT